MNYEKMRVCVFVRDREREKMQLFLFIYLFFISKKQIFDRQEGGGSGGRVFVNFAWFYSWSNENKQKCIGYHKKMDKIAIPEERFDKRAILRLKFQYNLFINTWKKWYLASTMTSWQRCLFISNQLCQTVSSPDRSTLRNPGKNGI